MPDSSGMGAVLRRALRLWRPHAGSAAAILACLLVQQGFTTYFALSLKRVIDHALGGAPGAGAALLPVLLSLVLFFMVAAAASLLGDYLTARVTAEAMNELRREMYAHLLRLPAAFFSRARAGNVAARFSSDLADVEKGLAERLPDGACALIGLCLNLPLMVLLDARLAILLTLALPIVSLGPRLLSRRAAAASYGRKQEEAALASLVHEHVRVQPAVRAFGQEDAARRRMEGQLERLRRSAVRAEFLAALLGQTSSLGVLLLQVVVLGAGSWLVLSGGLSAGTLVAVMSLLGVLTRDAYTLSKKVAPSLIKAGAGLRRVDELLGEPPEAADPPGAAPLPRLSREIRFDRVGFSHDGTRRHVADLSFTVRAGERVALVGPSGCGKSTVLGLLLRLHEPAAGSVSLDGRDLRGASRASLRAQIGVVLQDALLLNLSVRDNIRLGRPEATDEEVEAAARAAELHDEILQMPAGYDSPAGELGGLLSGGQRQRVALARAMLRDPAILLLDEATSALDPETEAQVLRTERRLSQGRTVISVTHRLASARDADRILVLDQGRLVEEGSHEELLARRGLYHQLWHELWSAQRR